MFAERGDKIAPLAVFQHRVAQIAGGDEPRGQLRDFAFLLFNNFVENVHGWIQNTFNIQHQHPMLKERIAGISFDVRR